MGTLNFARKVGGRERRKEEAERTEVGGAGKVWMNREGWTRIVMGGFFKQNPELF